MSATGGGVDPFPRGVVESEAVESGFEGGVVGGGDVFSVVVLMRLAFSGHVDERFSM